MEENNTIDKRIEQLDENIQLIHENLKYLLGLLRKLAEEDSISHVDVEERADEIAIPDSNRRAKNPHRFTNTAEKVCGTMKLLQDLFDKLTIITNDFYIDLDDLVSEEYRKYRKELSIQEER